MHSIGQRNALHRPSESIPFVVLKRSVFSERGLLQKGLLIRHLVLPNGKSDSEQLLRWIAQEFNPNDIRISLMRQYTPCGDLSSCPEINRKLFSMEYSSVLKIASHLGLAGYMQGRDCDNFSLTPKFDLTGVRKDFYEALCDRS